MESLRATVKAYAEGKIELGEVDEKTNIREMRGAPSFLPFRDKDAMRARASHPYTAWTLCGYLGWTRPSGQPTEFSYSLLSALELVEMGILKEKQFQATP